jgi:diguanylate cyclase (GGDEF)-like protein
MRMDTSKATILVVDDVPANIEILNGVLGNQYDVLFATNGLDAVEIAREQNLDLILLDVMMPGLDGYGVCSLLKAEEKTADIPVIFVTAMDQEEDESRGLKAGVVDYITKPVRPSIVKARVQNQLELKQYRDSLKTLSNMDGLTGIANRRRFDEILQSTWHRVKLIQSPVSLLMMDIDHFKAYNDNYGHLAGDACLRQLAGALSEIGRRSSDFFARFGGEEFALLLPETKIESAVLAAVRTQEKVRILSIPHAYSGVADYVTVSIGISTLVPSDENSQFDLIKQADKKLYEAKNNGRNRYQF